MFQGATNTQIYGGKLTVKVKHINSNKGALYQACHFGATHDSREREPPPRCLPGTRTEILEDILQYALVENTETVESVRGHILWLHGPAGAGKSAIAQTVAEACEEAGILAASFFFSRQSARRDTAECLFPTIAYQIAMKVPAICEKITMAVEEDPSTLSKSLEIQFRKLIVDPFRSLLADTENDNFALLKKPLLVILDGLDECKDKDVQSKILSYLADSISNDFLPLRFLILSRPEPHITSFFENLSNRHIISKISLYETNKSKQDVELYLRTEFKRIHDSEEHADTMRAVVKPWPSESDIQHILRKSGGYFIYVSTVIKFIDEEFFPPVDRLKCALDASPGSTAFAELDNLYHQILSTNPNTDILKRVLGYVLFEFEWEITIPMVEAFLGLGAGQVRLSLRGLHSLVQFSESGLYVQILHASFPDVLLDEVRGREYYIDKREYRKDIVHGMLRFIKDIHVKPPTISLNIKLQTLIIEYLRRHLMTGNGEQPLEDLRAMSFQSGYTLLIDIWSMKNIKRKYRKERKEELFTDQFRLIEHLINELKRGSPEPKDLIDHFVTFRDIVYRHRLCLVPPVDKQVIPIIQTTITLFEWTSPGHFNLVLKILQINDHPLPQWVAAHSYIESMRVGMSNGDEKKDLSFVFQTSLGNFLSDPERAGELFSPSETRHTNLAHFCMKILIDEAGTVSEDSEEYLYARKYWAEHLIFATPDDGQLLHYLTFHQYLTGDPDRAARAKVAGADLEELYMYQHLTGDRITSAKMARARMVQWGWADPPDSPDMDDNEYLDTELQNAMLVLRWFKKAQNPPKSTLMFWREKYREVREEIEA